jgi:peptidyl-prolyl cis-trans isomerase A (cyclophilin A)
MLKCMRVRVCFAPGAVYHSFFICLRDEPALDFGGARHPDGQGFAAFGRMVQGFDVVGHIFAQSEAQEYVEKAVRIERAILLG